MRMLFVLLSIVIFLSASSCAVFIPGFYPQSYYVAGTAPGPDFVWISYDHPDKHGHNGHWAHSKGKR